MTTMTNVMIEYLLPVRNPIRSTDLSEDMRAMLIAGGTLLAAKNQFLIVYIIFQLF